jgi:hypothetical protein
MFRKCGIVVDDRRLTFSLFLTYFIASMGADYFASGNQIAIIGDIIFVLC